MRISDWSSDVCSSDLFASVPSSIVGERAGIWIVLLMGGRPLILSGVGAMRFVSALWPERSRPSLARPRIIGHISPHWFTANHMGSARTCETERQMEIGRASCRERVCQYVWFSVVDVSFEKT